MVLFLFQRNYALDILRRVKILQCNPCRTLAKPLHKLHLSWNPISDLTLYRSLAGALQYLTFTKPNIVFALQQICLYMMSLKSNTFMLSSIFFDTFVALLIIVSEFTNPPPPILLPILMLIGGMPIYTSLHFRILCIYWWQPYLVVLQTPRSCFSV